MAGSMNLIDRGTKWSGNISLTKVGTTTVTLDTGGKHVDKDIELNLNLASASLSNGDEFYITVPNGSEGMATFHFVVDENGNTTIT